MSENKVAPPALRCAACGVSATAEDFRSGCPFCGSREPTHDPFEDVTISLNWQECRMLAEFASQWAVARYKATRWTALSNTLDRLRRVRPNGAPALTNADTAREMPMMEGAKRRVTLSPEFPD